MSSRLRYVLDEMYNYRWIHIGIIIFNAMIIFVAALNLIDLKITVKLSLIFKGFYIINSESLSKLTQLSAEAK